MIPYHQLDPLLEGKGFVLDPTGKKIGPINHFYVDNATSRPGWVATNTGLFGSRETLIPIRDAYVTGNSIVVNHPKDRVKDAPAFEPDEHLEIDEEQRLYEFWGISGDAGAWATEPEGDPEGVGVGDPTGPEFTRTGTGEDHPRTGLGTDRRIGEIGEERAQAAQERLDDAGRLRLRRHG